MTSGTTEARLLVQGDEPREVPITVETRIGREASCQIKLSNDDQVSRQHARVFREIQGYVLEDLKSRNGVFVNGRPVTRHVLKNGDLIQVGKTSIRFVWPEPVTADRIEAERTIIAEFPENHDIFGGATSQQADVNKLRKSIASLKTIYAVSEDLAGTYDLEKVLDGILSKIFEVVKADRGVIMLVTEDGSLRRAAQKVRGGPVTSDIPVSQTILNHVLKNRTAVLTTDASKDQRFAEGQSILLQHIRSAACVPFAVRRKIVGVLQVETTEVSRAFSNEDLELLLGIAGQAAIAIENVRLLRKVEEEAEIRTNLQRYLAPQIVAQVIEKKVNMRLGGEIQHVTVLFSDVRGFTRMTEELGAQEIVSTLNAYFSRMVGVVFEHGGTLDKFIGDAIMAIWGVPIGSPDDAVRAVRAAVTMQRDLFNFNLLRRTLGQRPLHMGVGLNTGDAVVGNMGSPKTMQFTAMGSAVNQASRIEGKTCPGQVLVSESTAGQVRGSVRLNELPPVELKGIVGKVKVFSATGLDTDEVPQGLEGLGEPASVVTFLPCRNIRTGRPFVGRGFDSPSGEFGMALSAAQADDLKEGDLVQIVVSQPRSTSGVNSPAGSTSAFTAPVLGPITFRVGSLVSSPPERQPPFVLATLLTSSDTH